MSIQQLLLLLNNVEKDNSIKVNNYLDDNIPIVNEIVNLANNLLITTHGQCNWKNISILEHNNFNIFPIEVDSFGWLIAGIQTSKGVIIYG
jgi:hypothetical protein